jgi:hypothetical protein
MRSVKEAQPSKVLFIGQSKRLKCPSGLIHQTQRSWGRRVRCSPSHRPVRLQLWLHVISMIMPRAPPTVTPPPVLRLDWKTLARITSTWSKPLDLDACPALTSLHQLCGAIDKPKPTWFWGPNQETVAMILSPKPPNRSCRFWGSTEKLVDLRFEAKLRNPHSLFPCAWCRPHTTSPDLLIVWPPSTRPMLNHPQSSAPSLLLLSWSSSLPAISHLSPTHHETSKHDSPHEQR